MMTLGEKIRQLRQTKGFSQEELAAHLNVSRQAVSKWEKSLSYPDTENLLALAAVFEVSADELAGIRRGEKENEPEEVAAETESPPIIQKRSAGPVLWVVAVGVLLMVLVPMWGLLQQSSAATPPGGAEVPAQSGSEPSRPAESTGRSGASLGGPEGPEQKDMVESDPPQSGPAGSTEQTDAVLPPPWSPVEELGEFALRWMTEDGWEHLTAGEQESFFPFGTTLLPTELEKVYDTDFSGMTLHVVSCGALTLRYLHVRDTGREAPETEWVDSVTTIVPGYETPRGISVGSDEAEVLRRYGDALIYVVKDSGSEVLCKHDYKYVYAPETAFGTAVIFYISGGHVAGLEIRRGDDAGNDAWSLNHKTRFPVKNGEPDFGQRQEPEQEEVDETWAVYIALHALRDDANLSVEEEYEHRKTIFQNLQYLDWWRYGTLGEAGKDDLTRTELLHWLKRQTTLSADEISGLLAGACRSNLDGWAAESYANALGRACAAYPVEYIKAMASEKFSGAERETVLVMTAHACAGQAQLLEKILPALEGDPLRYTDAERVWAEALARRLREAGS